MNVVITKNLHNLFVENELPEGTKPIYDVGINSAVIHNEVDGTLVYNSNMTDKIVVSLQKDPITLKQIVDAFRMAVEINKNSFTSRRPFDVVFTTKVSGSKNEALDIGTNYVIDGFEHTIMLPEPEHFGCIVKSSNGFGMFFFADRVKIVESGVLEN